jgi:hypothetical protein
MVSDTVSGTMETHSILTKLIIGEDLITFRETCFCYLAKQDTLHGTVIRRP